MKWFQHQARANRDTKLKKVLMKYGAEGYGLYWFCIEHICDTLEPRLTFELEHDSEILAHELRIDTLKVEEMMRYMVSLGLFEESEGVISCIKLASHLGDNLTRNPALKAIIKRSKSETVSDSMRLSQQEERRGEEKRGEKEVISSTAKAADSTPTKKIIELYHEILPDLPACKRLNPSRQQAIRRRHRDIMESDLDNWAGYFRAVSQSNFLMGRLPGKDWRANIDFLLTEKATTGVLEGKYS